MKSQPVYARSAMESLMVIAFILLVVSAICKIHPKIVFGAALALVAFGLAVQGLVGIYSSVANLVTPAKKKSDVVEYIIPKGFSPSDIEVSQFEILSILPQAYSPENFRLHKCRAQITNKSRGTITMIEISDNPKTSVMVPLDPPLNANDSQWINFDWQRSAELYRPAVIGVGFLDGQAYSLREQVRAIISPP
jgi:hypothetical protein